MYRRSVVASCVLILSALCAGTRSSSVPTIAIYSGNVEPLQDWRSTSSADFDGDMKPDLVTGTAVAHGYVLQVQFSTRVPPALLKLAGDMPGAKVISRDFNRDKDIDLIITSCTSLLPVAVFLGDGKGHFRPGNPWNYIPIGLDTPNHYNSAAAHPGAAGNTEEKRHLPFDALPGNLTAITPDAARCPARENRIIVPRAAATNLVPRAPPAPLQL